MCVVLRRSLQRDVSSSRARSSPDIDPCHFLNDPPTPQSHRHTKFGTQADSEDEEA